MAKLGGLAGRPADFVAHHHAAVGLAHAGAQAQRLPVVHRMGSDRQMTAAFQAGVDRALGVDPNMGVLIVQGRDMGRGFVVVGTNLDPQDALADRRQALLDREFAGDTRGQLQAFEAAVAACPEVMECYLMTGTSDYLLRIVAADLFAYERFLKSVLTQIPGIANIQSSFALRQVVHRSALPVSGM